MYSDVSKFPYSGGYVWISECCPQRFVSVFSGSIFEGSPHPPLVILKLLYHWACQTNIQNVTQWVSELKSVFFDRIFVPISAFPIDTWNFSGESGQFVCEKYVHVVACRLFCGVANASATFRRSAVQSGSWRYFTWDHVTRWKFTTSKGKFILKILCGKKCLNVILQ